MLWLVAFDGLLDTTREGSTTSKSHRQQAKPVNLDLERDAGAFDKEPDSPDILEDAQESLGLVSDDLSTPARHYPRSAGLDPQFG